MFRRPSHRRAACILQALDANFLAACRCYFGGGTRIVLELGEYRESADIDFLCSDADGYRALREAVTAASLGPLLRAPLALVRDVRSDQYGIRTFIDPGGRQAPLKFEIVREARIALTGRTVPVLGVPALDHTTCVAEKLLANADRGLDRSTLSRDLIDLAAMAKCWPGAFAVATRRAEAAYGGAIRRGLAAAAALFVSDRAYAERCLRELRATRSALSLRHIERWAHE